MLYNSTTFPLQNLIHDIGRGSIGLPELQRPFVWPNARIRDLLDSLYRGYPCGFLLLWQTGSDLRTIATNGNQVVPSLAIVDGQQRLTSLFAVMTGVEVIRSDYTKERIKIAFDPLRERFEVANAATAQDRAFIPDVAEMWRSGAHVFKVAGDYLARLREVRSVTEDETTHIQSSISRLSAIAQHQFNALVLSTDANVETVAEIFVRINGQGTKLNQANFILTLISVFWEDGRKQIESFSRAATGLPNGTPSPRNYFIEPSTDQLLRVIVGRGFRRGKLDSVYAALRGRVPLTGAIDPERREEGFMRLRSASTSVLNIASWQHFLSSLQLAGYRSKRMLTSDLALLYVYAIYLIGVEEAKVDRTAMRQAASGFFFMAAMTSRYVTSAETRFEADLAVLGRTTGPDGFVAQLRRFCDLQLTEDFWGVTLPDRLATSGAQTPALAAYHASLVLLDAKVLFSTMKVSMALDPILTGTKKSVEGHHLFSKDYLKSQGIADRREINQIANLAMLEWPTNLRIGAKPPAAYAPQLDLKLHEQDRIYHALPPHWWTMSYPDFLVERRRRMATVVQAAWQKLCGDKVGTAAPELTVAELLAGGETEGVEFKSTLKTNLHTGQADDKIQVAILKTVASFLNSGGGTLLVGVSDDGTPVGLAADGFQNEDKAGIHLANLIRDRIGELFLPYVHPAFLDQGNMRILSVRCDRAPKPAFVKDGPAQRLFVRGGNTTAELNGQAAIDYVKARFG